MDRPRVSVMAIAGNPIRNRPGHRLRRSKECLGRRQIAALAQHHIHQGTVSIDGPVEIAPAAAGFDVGFIDVPTRASPVPAALTEFVGKDRRELCLPFPDLCGRLRGDKLVLY